jgi:hypothetical protein
MGLKATLTLFIASVWFVNGLICKVLGFVPRHREIVGRILGESYADMFTIAIGLAEVLMAVWVLSGVKSRLATFLQIATVLAMNVLEIFLVPDLLLFGRFNLVLAAAFVIVVLYTDSLNNGRAS